MLFAKRSMSYDKSMRLRGTQETTIFKADASPTRPFSIGMDARGTPPNLPAPNSQYTYCDHCRSTVTPAMEYSYHALTDSNWIRLLTVEPGLPSTPIICQMQCFKHCEVSEKYETLSYSWEEGTERDTESCSITVNGAELTVQPNLWYALQRIRLANVPKILWVDALWCVLNLLAIYKGPRC